MIYIHTSAFKDGEQSYDDWLTKMISRWGLFLLNTVSACSKSSVFQPKIHAFIKNTLNFKSKFISSSSVFII